MKILNESQDISMVEIVPAKITNILKTKIPKEGVEDINKYIDKIFSNRSSLTGGQISLDFENKHLKPIASFVLDLSEKYCERFYKDCNMPLSKLSFSIHNMWSTHQCEGEYNPIHTHDTNTESGLSCFLYLKVPESIKSSSKLSRTTSFRGKGGMFDGNTDLLFGHSTAPPAKSFKFPGHMSVIPEEGIVYLFPKWIPHLAYPFYGPGERRTLGININIF